MKAGLVSISFRELDPGAIVAAAVECGLAGIEWGGDGHVPHGDTGTALEVGRLTEEAGLGIASYGSYYHFDECDPDSGANGPEMESVLDTAEALGAPAIRVWAGRRDPSETPEPVRAAITDRAREFAAAAAARGMRLDFEFHDHTLTATPESTLRLLEEVDHPAARTLWQPPLQTPVVDRLKGLRLLRDRVSNLHCNHFGQDPWPEIHSLSEGESEWRSYLAEFGPSDTIRWVLIEHVRDHSIENLKADARALRSWLLS
jgi:sugar phosphate isomerase/epimerase